MRATVTKPIWVKVTVTAKRFYVALTFADTGLVTLAVTFTKVNLFSFVNFWRG